MPLVPPTKDELSSGGGEPMETQRHQWQVDILIDALDLWFEQRGGGYVNGNMFVYFSLEQTRSRHLRGPDCFVFQRQAGAAAAGAMGVVSRRDDTSSRDSGELCSNLVYQSGLMEFGRRRTVADNAVVETHSSNERGAPCVTIRATEPAV